MKYLAQPQDNQNAVDIHVLQGERDFSSDNRTLGNFQLSGIPPAPRGVPQVEVTFDIDANGIVSVSAKDKATGKTQSITITGEGSLSDEEIQKMVDDAKVHEDEDREKKKIIEIRNKLDSLVYQSEKMISENRETISEDTLSNLENYLATSKEALDSDSISTLEDACSSLESAMHTLASELYSKGQENSAEEESPGSTAENDLSDDIIDAEFEEA